MFRPVLVGAASKHIAASARAVVGVLIAFGALVAATSGLVHGAPSPEPAYLADLSQWRSRADAGLRRERGWLSIVGRWELEPGRNRIGAAAGNDVVLPRHLSPATLGTLTIAAGSARLALSGGQKMRTVEEEERGVEFVERELCADGRQVEWVTAGRLSLQLVRRDDGKFVLRAADRDAPSRKSFAGRVWYDADPAYRIPARFVPRPRGTTIPIANVRGEISYEEVAGHLEFELDGATVRLAAFDDNGNLFVIFRDATSAKTTYPAGRFLAVKRPADGAWFVDFNRAHNPPCAFSAYTTCPLPPPQNWMKAAVPAGERYVERKS